MSRLVISADALLQLQKDLLHDNRESCAILLGRSVKVGTRLVRIAVREVVSAPPSAYAIRTRLAAQLRPEFVAEVTARARRGNDAVVFVHTHPAGAVEFSLTDDSGEKELAAFLARRGLNSVHAALLVTPTALASRILGRREPLRVAGVGRRTIWASDTDAIDEDSRYDRQIRLFGSAGQRLLRSMRVAS